MQKIPINYPKKQQSSALTTALITHTYKLLGFGETQEFFFCSDFNMHPQGSFCGEAAGSEMSCDCCWALQAEISSPQFKPCSCSQLPLLAFRGHLTDHRTSSPSSEPSSGQCQTGRHFAVIQKLGECRSEGSCDKLLRPLTSGQSVARK